MGKKKINWANLTEEERKRYDYYTSLNFDDKTASVLALYTYGRESVPDFSIREAYEAFAEDRMYPPDSPPFDFPDRRIVRPSMEATKDGGTSVFDTLFSGGMADTASGAAVPEAPMEAAPTMAPEPKARRSSFSGGSGNTFRDAANSFSPQLARKALRLSVFSTDEYEPIEEKSFRATMRETSSTFRMTTNTASVGVLFNQLRHKRPIDRSMVRIEEMLNYFRYRTEKPKEEMFRISTELKKRENGNRLLYINVQGKEEVKEEQNIVVLLDVSGSMRGNAVQTQAAVATVISRLKPGDTFSLVTYSRVDRVVLEGVKVKSKADITRFLEKLLGLSIGGGTYGSAGIETAYRIGKENYRPNGNNQVILITDGDLNFGITSQGGLEKLIEEKKQDHLFLSVIGTGLFNYRDNKLETLSKHGNGVYRVVNNVNDVKKSIRDEYASLVNVIAKDVKAQVEFNPEVVESFRLLGFENRELRHEDFTDDTVISEPFGSGGYGVALYELVLRDSAEPQTVENRYTRVVTTGSGELATVKVRYKEPLEDVSHEIEHVIADAEENWSDNLLLASVVYVCAEKLRDSDKIEARDETQALADFERLSDEIRVLNPDDLDKLRELLRRSKEQLGVTKDEDFDW